MTAPGAVPSRPALRLDMRAEFLEPDHVVVIGDEDTHVLTGAVHAKVLPLLDGHRTVDELAVALHPGVFPAEVFYAVDVLAELGLLVDGPAGDPVGSAFWNGFGVSAPAAQARLTAARVHLVPLHSGGNGADPRADLSALARSLGGLGVALTGETDGDLWIVVTDHYLHPGLAEINEAALRAGRPWLMAKLTGRSSWIGPLLRPGSTACWACLADRLGRNRQAESFVARHRRYSAPPAAGVAAIPSTLTAAASLTALAAAAWLACGSSELGDALLTLDHVTLATETHPVVRRPQCAACGDPGAFATTRAVALAASPKAPAGTDGHRARRPEETLERLRPHISPLTGVVTALVDLGSESGVSYNYAAGHHFAMGVDNVSWLRRSLRAMTGGKGTTEAEARMSAVGEAIERYVGVWQGDEHAVAATYRDLAGQAVHLRDLLHFSERQYEQRHKLNEYSTSPFQLVPNPFDEAQVIDWSAAWSLRDQKFRYVPSCFCYYGHPQSAGYFFSAGDTNGCAAGTTLEEAIVHAFLELVERDSVAIWWYNRLARPGVDLESFGQPAVSRASAYHDRLGRKLWALDLTADLGIPCFAGVSARLGSGAQDLLFGFGAHLDPAAALLRALAEVNQFLPAVSRVDGHGNTVYAWPEDDAVNWWRHETLASQPHLVPDPDLPARRGQDFARLGAPDLRDDVLTCVELAGRAGLDVLVLDQSRPDIELSVCRVIVPGLRHFWRRLGPGRLYDVPVRMGWLPRPLTEDEMNPLSVFI